ncbi:MAG: threonylcarbamoyl-AMP synthase [Deltaproteobacteria bacterium RIFCSPLOWO2_12_FULL_40_28]|nr:MAG: threonylcarbamoyl-AMP synthase [Deltaproteobacteria bacterium RIFCSPHIGHO2_02_FULL_40_28]OGQ20862.1 MAG: threonylcarbamoyl-AMP synthase [Deltaproteobacteria bacterium RIFCSPHIGHO2_12_FULL_40_32]OGQ39263.1 MAG: threonylcarbamoyl-AMP synthase [Deltaproteobacteria bacterium RIFCSPLOWO2_02_FULL_40_36]OGQ54544.1 MAG: threonylcarbamoyl-AMP synthase [Deltaproteobacteria bacterium RIFCSPLOWO2_12_FULL_40_28]
MKNSRATLDEAEAKTWLQKKELVIYPTESFFALGCDPRDITALKKIFQVKGRDLQKPIPLILASSKYLDDWIADINPLAQKLISLFWPGPLTLVMKAKKEVSKILTAGGDTLGVRVSSHPVAESLAMSLGGAITSTSANISYEEPPFTCDQLSDEMMKQVKGFVPGLPHHSKPFPSTIIDLTRNKPVLLRKGQNWEAILSAIKE